MREKEYEMKSHCEAVYFLLRTPEPSDGRQALLVKMNNARLASFCNHYSADIKKVMQDLLALRQQYELARFQSMQNGQDTPAEILWKRIEEVMTHIQNRTNGYNLIEPKSAE